MLNPRMCALEIIHETVKEGAYANLLYKKYTNDFEDRDRKLITLLVNETLSNLIHIDYILAQFIGGKSVKPIIRNILRMGVAQMKLLNFPSHAVINESVILTKSMGKGMLSGFVNGVLRNIDRCEEIKYPKEGTLEYYSVVNSKPLWLLELWADNYGEEQAIKYSEIRKTPTYVRVNTQRGRFDDKEWFGKNGYDFKKVDIVDNCYELENSYNLHTKPEYRKGLLNIQGIGSMIACQALNVQSGDNVLDCCAAPGGKTVYIAELMGKGSVTACDLYENRLNLIKVNARRTGYDFIKTQAQDMSKFNPDFENAFDKVLVDAPCSGLGVINSKPDILLSKTLDKVKDLAKIQYKILDNCCKYVKENGVLVYSTCTINKIENDDVVNKFLKEHKEFVLDSIVLNNGQKFESGMLQLTPDQYEGFFVAKFKRV